MKKLTLNFDGSCEPVNPGGRMGFGFVVKESKQVLHGGHGSQEAANINSNNVAEYMALICGLEWLIANGHTKDEIKVYGDSRLVINQMAGEWRAKGGMYFSKYELAISLRDQFTNISFQWVGRDQNSEADELSRVATNQN